MRSLSAGRIDDEDPPQPQAAQRPSSVPKPGRGSHGKRRNGAFDDQGPEAAAG
ncbi:hypothetical protein [Streptomyces lavendulae]|uniref:hypothetical protein n=1 Tax=Streptomyces lavendulae TaxID=1914 RepID=UPI0031E785B8